MFEISRVTVEVLMVGVTILFTIGIRYGLRRIRMPAMVGYLTLGFLISLTNSYTGFLSEQILGIYEFLARVGVIVLLFHVGMKSNLSGLLKQLRRASVIWVGNILFSGLLGFAVARYLMGIRLIPSLFVGTALTATSLGISIAVWREANAIDSENGELLLDIAEMDDISGVMLMALLFTIAPVLKNETGMSLAPILGKSTGLLLLKALFFGSVCLLFSKYAEEPLTDFFRNRESMPALILFVAGIGLIIAALAGLLGLSVAVGALFAGLVFSRDPEVMKREASFEPLFDFFTPFFFIGIGLMIKPDSLISSIGLGAIVLLVAIMGKLIGTGLPALIVSDWKDSLLLSVSMIPRAEIAMIIVRRGHKLGNWAVPAEIFSAIVFASMATSIISPIGLRDLLNRWPQVR